MVPEADMAQLFLFMTLVLPLLQTTVSSVIPPTEVKPRLVDKPLSEEMHFRDDEHNSDYDHEAFLGKDQVKEFEQMEPNNSKEQLGIIYDKIDKNGDEKVTEEELRDWIGYVQNRYLRADTDRQWSEQNPDDTPTLFWDAYKLRVYGFVGDVDTEDVERAAADTEARDESGRFNYRVMLHRDKRRWARADVDRDGELSKEEFASFIHPEDSDHMRDIIIDETVEDIDGNKDGRISLDEYIHDMWPEKDEEEPEWVKSEREQFSRYRDLNQDGFMDRDEVQHWISPPAYDHLGAEAKHLMLESDSDKDGSLTKEEMLDRYDVFVSSQATDYGEALRRHDEF